jgi:osmotically-inducible protein OsmY
VASDLKVKLSGAPQDDSDIARARLSGWLATSKGVADVTDLITVKPPVSPEKVQAVIEDAFKREAEIDARHIRVEVSDHTAKLYRHVHSLHEAGAAGAAPTAAPGVATVESHPLVSP